MAIATALIGRRTELETIERVVEAARAGRSAVLVVRGVAGVGKTALLEHAAEAAGDLRILRAEGVEAESELAFAGLHQLLRPLAPLLDRLPALQRSALEAAFGVSAGEPGDRFLAAAGALGRAPPDRGPHDPARAAGPDDRRRRRADPAQPVRHADPEVEHSPFASMPERLAEVLSSL